MSKTPYHLSMPEDRTTSVVFASPHSGRDYSWAFLRKSVLDEHTIRSSEDAFVDQLLEAAVRFGAPVLSATVPRAFVDVNRSAEELDPALIEGVRSVAANPRIASGLGVIPRVVANGRAIYRGKLTAREAEQRISGCWRPYHETLQGLLDDSMAKFHEAILIDCHSMPHEAIESINHPGGRPDIVLGDRFGAAAHPEIVVHVERAFRAAGLKVARNARFAGAYITQHYGRPSRGQHVVQVEIDRSIYMNEERIRPNGNFASFRRTMSKILSDIADVGRQVRPLAAE